MKIGNMVWVAVAAVSITLTACEQPQQSSNAAIAAKVGSDVISEADLSHAVSRLAAMGKGDAMQARDQILEALIDQRLISNAAINAKLDKDPQIALALAQAQRQVLAEAYMARMLKDVAKPSDTAINDYYAQHPELFSDRRIYRLQEIELSMPSARVPEVETQLKQSRNMADFSGWLKTQGVASKADLAVKPAEQIPTSILAQLRGMEEGQIVVVANGPERISVLQLQATQAQPVTLDQARGAIERVLQARSRKDLLDAEIKKLRSSEKIEYGKGFSPAVSGETVGNTGSQPAAH